MILEVQHETRFAFSEPVVELVTELRMEPASDGDQSCHSFHLAISPKAEVFRYQDGLGNRVHHFNLLPAHGEMRILAAAVVETHPRLRDPRSSQALYPPDADWTDLGVLDFLKFRGPVRRAPRLAPLQEALKPQNGTRLVELVLHVSEYIHGHFAYARNVTLVNSPIDHLLEQGRGVCQDFTHLMIALLRGFGVPARYVSGYIHRPNEESQSHAWCEAWLPDFGWFGVDPTNARLVDENFIKVAVGRDFSDVPPNKGVYRGNAQESISVRVETRALERLPSLSWQEQLPPLNTPLTTMLLRPRNGSAGEDEQQQQ